MSDPLPAPAPARGTATVADNDGALAPETCAPATPAADPVAAELPADVAPLDAQVESPPPSAAAPAAAGAKATRWVAVLVLVLFVLLIAWQVASDRLVPYTARGAVSGYVAQLAPRVAGQVTEVMVQDGGVVQAGAALAQLDLTPFDLAVR